MKLNKKINLTISSILLSPLFALLAVQTVKGQVDPHFSQYYSNPLWLNPAMTGAVDGDYRATMNFKEQWSSVGSGYNTGSVSFDMAPVKQLAFGAIIMNQSAGDIKYNYLNALVSAAYRVRFRQDGLNMLNFGLQAGMLNRSFDPSKITLGSQYNPITGYDPTMPFDETFQSSSTLVPDINAGLMYFDSNPGQKVNLFGGVSAAHINTPRDRFLGGEAKIPVRYAVHGGARVKVNEMISLTPHAIYLRQNNAREISAGAYGQLMLQDNSNFLFGSSYRFDDSVNGFLGIQLKSLVFSVGYDVNTSSLQTATRNRGGLEFSIAFTRRSGIVGPNFFCPRL